MDIRVFCFVFIACLIIIIGMKDRKATNDRIREMNRRHDERHRELEQLIIKRMHERWRGVPGNDQTSVTGENGGS